MRDTIDMAREVYGAHTEWKGAPLDRLEQLVALVRADERALAAPVQPVAYLCENAVGHKYFRWKKPSSTYKPIALYTIPPAQRQWVGLTDEERTEIRREHYARTLPLMDAVEAKLRNKNT
jgi:hypothetical protein